MRDFTRENLHVEDWHAAQMRQQGSEVWLVGSAGFSWLWRFLKSCREWMKAVKNDSFLLCRHRDHVTELPGTEICVPPTASKARQDYTPLSYTLFAPFCPSRS